MLQKIDKIQFDYFQVIRQEIEILQPNIMVFLTGYNYDHFIKKNIGDFKQEKISDSLYRLKFIDKNLDIISFNTYHPNGLYRLKKNRIVIPNLIREIKNACI